MADLGAIAVDYSEPVYVVEVLASAAAPLPPRLAAVSGVVYDDASAPCARVVRAYRRSDGALVDQTVSDAVTGAYELACTDDEVDRVVLDDDGGALHNDLIDRVIPG
jgi:hypothetical protein